MSSTYVILKTDKKIKQAAIEKAFRRLLSEENESKEVSPNHFLLTFSDGLKGLVRFEANFAALNNDLEGGLTSLIIPSDNDLFLSIIDEAPVGKMSYLYEVADLTPSIYDRFAPLIKQLDSDTLFTVLTYIETGRSPALSALRLYVHRNTVAYRLSRFVDESGITIDSYGNERFVHELIKRQKLNLEEGYI